MRFFNFGKIKKSQRPKSDEYIGYCSTRVRFLARHEFKDETL